MATSQKPPPSEWMQKNGFGVLCIHDAGSEHFVVVPADDSRIGDLTARGVRLWVAASESEATAELVAAGLSRESAQEAVAVAREWTTTIVREPGAPRVLWALRSDI